MKDMANLVKNYGITIEKRESESEYFYPNIVESIKFKWINEMPKDCPDQGAW